MKASRNRWTDDDIAYIRANASAGAKAIATALNRSEATVRNKAVQLGVSLRLPGSTVGRRSKAETVSVDLV
ncbi:hypothetical protein EBZ39_06825 [bacterium]|nr:hypothetical protein [bacterium]